MIYSTPYSRGRPSPRRRGPGWGEAVGLLWLSRTIRAVSLGASLSGEYKQGEDVFSSRSKPEYSISVPLAKFQRAAHFSPVLWLRRQARVWTLEFLEDGFEMPFDGVGGDDQPLGDFLVGQPLGEQIQHFAFAFGQGGQLAACTSLLAGASTRRQGSALEGLFFQVAEDAVFFVGALISRRAPCR